MCTFGCKRMFTYYSVHVCGLYYGLYYPSCAKQITQSFDPNNVGVCGKVSLYCRVLLSVCFSLSMIVYYGPLRENTFSREFITSQRRLSYTSPLFACNLLGETTLHLILKLWDESFQTRPVVWCNSVSGAWNSRRFVVSTVCSPNLWGHNICLKDWQRAISASCHTRSYLLAAWSQHNVSWQRDMNVNQGLAICFLCFPECTP